jgi:hypothetical protein
MRKSEGENHLEYLDLNIRIILNWVLKKEHGRIRNEVICLRIEKIDELL